MMYRIIHKRLIFFIISTVVILASLMSLYVWRLNPGLDFAGGSLLEVEFINYQPTVADLQGALSQAGLSNLLIQPTADSVIIRFKDESWEAHAAVTEALEQLIADKEGASFTELQFDSIGASIGQELKRKSFNATLLVLIMIIIYISLAFRRVSKPVASWKYGVAAIIALFHDVIITLGIFAALGKFYGTEINSPFIAAILMVIGYSINDTIIVFDRIRENLPKSQENFAETVNRSVNQTITRSINTSFSSVLALTAVLFFGGDTIKDFALVLVIGILVGTYSSIFIASPILVVWDKWSRKLS